MRSRKLLHSLVSGPNAVAIEGVGFHKKAEITKYATDGRFQSLSPAKIQ
jgi:hypothetical protein